MLLARCPLTFIFSTLAMLDTEPQSFVCLFMCLVIGSDCVCGPFIPSPSFSLARTSAARAAAAAAASALVARLWSSLIGKGHHQSLPLQTFISLCYRTTRTTLLSSSSSVFCRAAALYVADHQQQQQQCCSHLLNLSPVLSSSLSSFVCLPGTHICCCCCCRLNCDLSAPSLNFSF